MDKLLNLGCGDLIGKHWLNADSSLNVFLDNHPWIKGILAPLLPVSSKTSKFQRAWYMDLRTRWRFGEGAFDAIYSSHFFEHLGLEEGQHVLGECFRCLKPGGQIRFLLPSVEKEINAYLQKKASGNPLAATELAKELNIFSEPPAQGSWWYRLYLRFYDKNSHKMLYDTESLKVYFAQAGFTHIVERAYLDSQIPFLGEVERADRFTTALCLEARKPQAAEIGLRLAS